MGLQIGDIVPRKSISFADLKGKTICVDAFNAIYQFLASIRQPDGTPLMDSKGRITSHLSGLFYRNISLLVEGIKVVYVFDGKPPALKHQTHEMRQAIKDNAKQMYEKAVEEEDIDSMGKYSRQLSRLNEEMIITSKSLVGAMGITVIQAPSEGESQASFLAKTQAYAVGSQDYDALLFGAPRLIQNLTLAKTRKTVSGTVYISPEMIELEKVLHTLQINLDQLICLGILVGTDYNPKGIRGIGQKRALQIVRQFRQPVLIFQAVQKQIEEQKKYGEEFDWQTIYELFHKPNIDTTAKIEFPKFDESRIREILISYDFSPERIGNQLAKLQEAKKQQEQKTLV